MSRTKQRRPQGPTSPQSGPVDAATSDEEIIGDDIIDATENDPNDDEPIEDSIIDGDNIDVGGDDFDHGDNDQDPIGYEFEEDDGPRHIVHPLLPAYAFPCEVNVIDFSDTINVSIANHLMNTANTGKPLVIYRVDRNVGEYCPIRRERLNKRVPGAVVLSWEEYKRLSGASEVSPPDSNDS